MNQVSVMLTESDSAAFREQFQGRFINILRWPMLDELWANLKNQADDSWYVYAVGEEPPKQAASSTEFLDFLVEIENLLRKEHDEDYCGIVYADDLQAPSMVKIFDPNNLGASCGASGELILPGWLISRIKPVDFAIAFPPPANRRRWWSKLFSS